MNTTTAATDLLVHPFDHIGPGPYTYVGMRDHDAVNEVLIRQGLDGNIQEGGCIGCCDHCGTAITIGILFKTSDGKLFKTGETCAKKALLPKSKALSEAVKACNERRTKIRNQKTLERYHAACEWLESDRFINGPHPKGCDWLTLKDYLTWYKQNAGRAKFVEICTKNGFKS
jgi:hypothetical protein